MKTLFKQKKEREKATIRTVTVDFFFNYRGLVTSEGASWAVKQGGVLLMFPPDAVFEPTPIVVRSWKSSVCSPPLQGREAIISNVIEISSMDGQGLKFNAKVKLSLSHNATDTRGHEPVIKMLIGKESNEWVDVNGTMDLRCCQGIEISFCIYMVFYFLDKKIYACLRSTKK